MPFNNLLLTRNMGRVFFFLDVPSESAQSLSPSLLSAGLTSALESCPPTGPWSLYWCLYAALLLASCTDRVPWCAAPPVCRLTLPPYPTASPGSVLSVPVAQNQPRIQPTAPAEATATLNFCNG